jgi:hypothetical protein
MMGYLSREWNDGFSWVNLVANKRGGNYNEGKAKFRSNLQSGIIIPTHIHEGGRWHGRSYRRSGKQAWRCTDHDGGGTVIKIDRLPDIRPGVGTAAVRRHVP